MKLSELHPQFLENDSHLMFDCPTCPKGDNGGECGGIAIPIDRVGSHGKCWGWNGEHDFEKVTLTPSIWHHCKSDPHFFIREGEIIFA